MRRQRDQDALELLVVGLVLYRLAVRQEVKRRVQGALERARDVLSGDPRADPSRARPAPLGSRGLT